MTHRSKSHFIHELRQGATPKGEVFQDLLDSIEIRSESELVFEKTISKTWTELFTEIETTGITSLNGFEIIILIDTGDMPMGDIPYNSPAWTNGKLRFKAKTSIGTEYGITQTSAIVSNHQNSSWNFRGNIDIVFDNVELKIDPNGNPTPFHSEQNDIFTNKCWFNALAATDHVNIFMLGKGDLDSVNDTFTGNATYNTSLVLKGYGEGKIAGGLINLINSHYNTNAFTYATKGYCSVITNIINASFINIVDNGMHLNA